MLLGISWPYWAAFLGAIAFEVAGTIAMKLADGFSKLTPSILLFIFYGISFALCTYALKKFEITYLYAIWSGLGTAAVAIIGYFFFGEMMSVIKFISLVLIIAGVAGLNLTGAH